MACPESNALAAYADGVLPEAESHVVQGHLDHCEECRQLLGALAQSEALRGAPPGGARERWTSPGSTAEIGAGAALEPGSTIERYVILSLIGVGGMGAVYQAYDPALDRHVAIKLLRRPSADSSEASREQLRREARALARLSNPNVITIYEVGRLDGHDFLVLEYVRGQTLAAWCGEPRPWRRVLAHVIAAGHGLAAAHGAGIVHRDFKPSNVLVGADGRARVSDFGLAGEADPAPGSLAGTPLYMAPELFAGALADSRSDQWSFAATAWEMLTGSPVASSPHAATPAPPTARNVPARVLRVLRRALAPRPDDRFDSLASALGALQRAAGRPRWLAVAALAAVVAASGLAWLHRDDAFARCDRTAADIDALLVPDRRDALRATFAATAGEAGRDSAGPALARLDGYLAGWKAMAHQTCEARRDRALSGPLLDRRTLCLERRRREVSGLIELLSTTRDRQVVVRAAEAASGLPPAGECGERGGLLARYELPEDGQRRAALEAVSAEIAQAMPLRRTGQPREAVRVLRAAVASAGSLGHLATQAEAHERLAEALLGAGEFAEVVDATSRGLEVSAQASDDAALAWHWLYRMTALLKLARYDDALGAELAAATAISRAGGDAGLRARLLQVTGSAWMMKADSDRATALLRQALALAEQRTDAERETAIADVHQDLANLLLLTDRAAEARSEFERVVKIDEASLGPAHPTVASAYYRLATAELASRDDAQAPAHLRRALAIQEAALGDVQTTAYTLTTLAGLLRGGGQFDEAWGMFERARRIFESQGGNPTALAAVAHNEALLRRDQGRQVEAVELLRRALDLETQAVGAQHPATGDFAADLSDALFDLGGADDEVQQLRERSLAARRAAYGDDHLYTASARVAIGEVALARGQLAAARAGCGRSLAFFGPHPPPPDELAGALRCLGGAELALGKPGRAIELATRAIAAADDAAGRFLLARALWTAGRDPARAIDEARKARALADAAAPRATRERKAIAAWLAAHAR